MTGSAARRRPGSTATRPTPPPRIWRTPAARAHGRMRQGRRMPPPGHGCQHGCQRDDPHRQHERHRTREKGRRHVGSGSHGSTTRPGELSGALDAPARHNPNAAAPAARDAASATAVTGSRATLAAPPSAGEIEPCDSHAAIATSTATSSVQTIRMGGHGCASARCGLRRGSVVEWAEFYMERGRDTIGARAGARLVLCRCRVAAAVLMTWPLATRAGPAGPHGQQR